MGDLVPAPPRHVIDYFPHPITTEDRTTIIAVDGQTLDDVFQEFIPRNRSAIAVVNGCTYSRRVWDEVVIREGDIVQVRVAVGGDFNPIAALLSIAVLIVAPYLGAAGAPFILGNFYTGTQLAAATGLLTAAAGLGGLLVINALFPSRLPKQSEQGQAPRQYSLSGGSNRARPYEPLLLVLGEHRVFPDLETRGYTEFDGEGDQFLNQIFDFGLGNLQIGILHIGDTEISNFEDVATQTNLDTTLSPLVAGNVDSITGGDLEYNTPLLRTTAINTTAVAFDIVCQMFTVDRKGKLRGDTQEFRVEWRLSGTPRAMEHP